MKCCTVHGMQALTAPCASGCAAALRSCADASPTQGWIKQGTCLVRADVARVTPAGHVHDMRCCSFSRSRSSPHSHAHPGCHRSSTRADRTCSVPGAAPQQRAMHRGMRALCSCGCSRRSRAVRAPSTPAMHARTHAHANFRAVQAPQSPPDSPVLAKETRARARTHTHTYKRTQSVRRGRAAQQVECLGVQSARHLRLLLPPLCVSCCRCRCPAAAAAGPGASTRPGMRPRSLRTYPWRRNFHTHGHAKDGTHCHNQPQRPPIRVYTLTTDLLMAQTAAAASSRPRAPHHTVPLAAPAVSMQPVCVVHPLCSAACSPPLAQVALDYRGGSCHKPPARQHTAPPIPPHAACMHGK
jgi:hypothetical protein